MPQFTVNAGRVDQDLPVLGANIGAVAIQSITLVREGFGRDAAVAEPVEPQLESAD